MAVYDSLQPVFNKVWEEFVVNKRERAHDGEQCVYRGSSLDDATGLLDHDPQSDVRCAIGVCIPDNMYNPVIEGHGIMGAKATAPQWYEDVFNGIEAYVLKELQLMHDNERRFSNFEGHLRAFADNHNLYIPSRPDEMPIPGVGINDLK